MEDSKESIWSIIKNATRDYIKAETSSSAGIANLIFGLILAALFLAIQASEIAEFIGKILKKDFDIGMPWYGNLIAFISLIGYFWYCVKELMNVDKLKLKSRR